MAEIRQNIDQKQKIKDQLHEKSLKDKSQMQESLKISQSLVQREKERAQASNLRFMEFNRNSVINARKRAAVQLNQEINRREREQYRLLQEKKRLERGKRQVQRFIGQEVVRVNKEKKRIDREKQRILAQKERYQRGIQMEFVHVEREKIRVERQRAKFKEVGMALEAV